METKSNLQSKALVVFIGSLILGILFYLILYLFNLSKPIHIRFLFSIISLSGTTFAYYGFSSIINKHPAWISKTGLTIASLHFILLLFAIWSNASFLAGNWLLLEISSAIIILSSFGVLFFNFFSKA